MSSEVGPPGVTFTFGDVVVDHVTGDKNCTECWLDITPPHECGTPGCLEHTEFGDENSDGDYWLFRYGDLCREP